MYLSNSERTVVLIDGWHLSTVSRELGFVVDFRNLLALLRRQTQLVRAVYYSVEADEDGESPLRPLLDWLDYNGYSVATKPVRSAVDTEGRRHPQGDMRVELAVDAMEIAAGVDHLVLVAGHDSFARLAAALRRGGKRVTVLSTLTGARTMVSDALRRQADHFVDVSDLRASIAMAAKDNAGARPAVDEDGVKEAKSTAAEKAKTPNSSSTPTAESTAPIAVVVERRTRARKTRTPS